MTQTQKTTHDSSSETSSDSIIELPSVRDSFRAKPANDASEGELVWLHPDQLVPWKDNPRANDGEPVSKVAESIKRFGFGAPIVARVANREIIAGHTRWKASKKLRLERVPVRLLDVDEHNAHLLAVADNRLTELTKWSDGLNETLKAFDSTEQELAGWTKKDIDELEKKRSGAAEDPEEDEVPALPKNPITAKGDVWTLGRHRLICGDCRDPLDVGKLIGEAKVNLAFTSPPYASQREYDEASGFKPIPPDEFVAWFDAVQANVRSVLAPDGSWFVNIKEHCDDGQRVLYVKDLTLAHVRQWNWRLVDEFCWTRQGVPGAWNNRFKNGWEPIFHFAQESSIKFRPQNVLHESSDVIEYSPSNPKSKSGSGLLSNPGIGKPGMARPNNVIQVATGGATTSAEHSAAFPVALPSFFIRAYTDPSDNVFDPFAGSGTTLVAAEQLDRTCFGIELSPAYCDVIVERWQNLTGGKAERRAAA